MQLTYSWRFRLTAFLVLAMTVVLLASPVLAQRTPTPLVASPIAIETREASETVSPQASAVVTAAASPGGSPQATAAATEESSPVVSPQASAVASPAASQQPLLTFDGSTPTVNAGAIQHFPATDGASMIASPDGRLVAIAAPTQLCVYRITDGKLLSCADLNKANISKLNEQSVVWSPDNMFIAFAESFLPTSAHSVDSDIWRFEPATGKLRDLTDDGRSGTVGHLQALGAHFNADTFPAWSPDSKRIYFRRSSWDGAGWITAIVSITYTGGDLRVVAQLEPGTEAATPRGPLAVTADGFVVFTHDSGDPSTTQNGIWQASLDGTIVQQLYQPPVPSSSLPEIVAVSPDGTNLLVRVPSEDDSEDWTYGLLDLETGVMKLIVGEEAGTGRTLAAAYGPDGKSIVFAWQAKPNAPVNIYRRSILNASELLLVSNAPSEHLTISWSGGAALVIGFGDSLYRVPRVDVPDPQVADAIPDIKIGTPAEGGN